MFRSISGLKGKTKACQSIYNYGLPVTTNAKNLNLPEYLEPGKSMKWFVLLGLVAFSECIVK